MKTGLVAPVNMMRVIPNLEGCLCGHTKSSDKLSMCKEEVYAITRAQKAQVSILKSQSTESRNLSPPKNIQAKKYSDPVMQGHPCSKAKKRPWRRAKKGPRNGQV